MEAALLRIIVNVFDPISIVVALISFALLRRFRFGWIFGGVIVGALKVAGKMATSPVVYPEVLLIMFVAGFITGVIPFGLAAINSRSRAKDKNAGDQ